MQTGHSEVTHIGVVAAMGAGTWAAMLLGLDPGTATALLGLAALASAQIGFIAGLPGAVPLPSTPEDLAVTLPVGDDASPDSDVLGFDADLF